VTNGQDEASAPDDLPVGGPGGAGRVILVPVASLVAARRQPPNVAEVSAIHTVRASLPSRAHLAPA
jgi:hypothetical protein